MIRVFRRKWHHTCRISQPQESAGNLVECDERSAHQTLNDGKIVVLDRIGWWYEELKVKESLI